MEKFSECSTASDCRSRTSSELLLDEGLPIAEKLHQQQRHISRKYFYIHLGVFVLYISLGTFLTSRIWGVSGDSMKCPSDELIHSPATDAIGYHRVTWDNPLDGNSTYTGQPTPEVDAAWRDLVQYMNIRVSKDDLKRTGQMSVPLSDEEGGYLASLDVYHELHCVNLIRKHIYQDYYPDDQPMAKQLEHVDHCIDILRNLVMCKGDTSLMTYSWIEGYRKPWPNFRQDHVCRNFDLINEWSRKHHIPVQNLQGSILTHPVYGDAWPVDGI